MGRATSPSPGLTPSATVASDPPGGEDDPPPPGEGGGVGSVVEVARRAGRSAAQLQRRFEMLPVDGLYCGPQGRTASPSTSPDGLDELVSSIGSVGLLQPILAEERPEGGWLVVAGERRLRAIRLGAAGQPGNPHFAAVPAMVCPGPLGEKDRRSFQLIENLARTDLQPGELAAALVWERCAVLAGKLLAAGMALPEDLPEDPLARFRVLDRQRVRAGLHGVGAPWEEVLGRLGVRFGPDRARQLVRALVSLPSDLSMEMDEAKVALSARLELVRLDAGNRGAAAELWAAVRDSGDVGLLASAVDGARQHPELAAAELLERARAARVDANGARAEALRRRAAADSGVGPPLVSTAAVLGCLEELLGQLRRGAVLDRYELGSLRLQLDELNGFLELVDEVEVVEDDVEGHAA